MSIQDLKRLINNTQTTSNTSPSKADAPSMTSSSGRTAPTAVTYYDAIEGRDVTAVFDVTSGKYVTTTPMSSRPLDVKSTRGFTQQQTVKPTTPIRSSLASQSSLEAATRRSNQQASRLAAQRAQTASILKDPNKALTNVTDRYNTAVDDLNAGRMTPRDAEKEFDAISHEARNVSAQMIMAGMNDGGFTPAHNVMRNVGNTSSEISKLARPKADEITESVSGRYGMLATLTYPTEREAYIKEMEQADADAATTARNAEIKRLSGLYATLATLTDEAEAIEYLREVSPELAAQREELVRLTTVNRKAGQQQFLNTLESDEEKLEYLSEVDPKAAAELAATLYQINQNKMAMIQPTESHGMQANMVYSDAAQKALNELRKEQEYLAGIMQMSKVVEAFTKSPSDWKRMAEATKILLDDIVPTESHGMQANTIYTREEQLKRDELQAQYDKYREYYFITNSAQVWATMSEPLQALALEAAKLDPTATHYTSADSVSKAGLLASERAAASAADRKRIDEIKGILSENGYDPDQVLAYASRYYNAAATQAEVQKTEEFATLNWATGALSTVASYATSLLSGLGAVSTVVKVANGADASVDEYVPIDANDPLYAMSTYTTTIRGAVGQQMSATGEYLYNALNSAIDSAARMLVAKGVASGMTGAAANTVAYQNMVSNIVSAQMSSQVFVNTFLEAKRSGMTDRDALASGLASAGIEFITEKISVGEIIKEPNAFTARALAHSYMSESLEEGASKFLGSIRDLAHYKEDSELMSEYRGYVEAGLSEKDAILLVVGNYAQELSLEMMAGGLSGFGMSAANQVGSYLQIKGEHSIDAYRAATPQIVEVVLAADANNKLANEIAAQMSADGVDSVKASAIYKLVGQNRAVADEAVRQVEFAAMVEEAAPAASSVESATEQTTEQPAVKAVSASKHTAIVQDAIDRFNAGEITNAVYERVYDAAIGKDGKSIQEDLHIDLSASGGLTTAAARKKAVKAAIQDIAAREVAEAAEAKAVAKPAAENAPSAEAIPADAIADEKPTEFEPAIKLAIEAQKNGDKAKVASFAQTAPKSPKIMAQLDLVATGKVSKDKKAIIDRIADLSKEANPQPATANAATVAHKKSAKLEPYNAFARAYKTEHPDATELQIRAAYAHQAATKVREGQYVMKGDGTKADYTEFRASMITAAREAGQSVSEEQISALFDKLYADQKVVAARVKSLQKVVDKLNNVFQNFGSKFVVRLSTSADDFPTAMRNEAAFINYKTKEIVVNARVVTDEAVLIKKVGHEVFHPGAKADGNLVEEFLAFCRELNTNGKLEGKAKQWMDNERATVDRKVAIYQQHENEMVARGRKAKADTITEVEAKTELACDMFGELFDKTAFAADIVEYQPSMGVVVVKKINKILKAFGFGEVESKTYKEHKAFVDKLAGFESRVEAALAEKAEKESAEKAENDVLDTAFKDYAIESIAAAAGIKAVEDEKTGHVSFVTTTGVPVEEVLKEDIRTASGLGALIYTAYKKGFISEEEADQQYEAVATIINMIIKTKDPQMVWKFAGASMFSALKANADGQYRTTIDFSTICRKTQEMIDAMSDAMMQLGRGLTKEEVIELQNTLHGVGANVPCPVCYVFSRWAGVGELLDRMNKWQNKYENYSEEQLTARITALENVYAKTATIKTYLAANDIEYQRLANERSALADAVKDLNKQVRRKTETDKEGKLKQIAQKKATIESIDEQMKELVKAEGGEYAWLTKVRAKAVKDAKTGKVLYVPRDSYNPVPHDVLFNLSNAEKFASDPRYKDSWKYRTTRGPSMGKAILPYSDMRIGDMILGVGKNSADGNKTFDPATFVPADGAKKTQAKLNDAQQKAYDLARKRTVAQNLIGGQRFLSTSDFRYDYALDYLMAFLEAQALGSSMQTYTKILEFAEMAAAIGGDVNISVMPKDAGYKDGKLIFSNVTGVNYEGAVIVSNRYDNAQLILVGINDEHIRLALEDSEETGGNTIGFVIPYHASGASIENFIKKLVENLKESFVSENYVDYSDVQNDKAKGAGQVTEEQSRRELLRLKILTGNETEEYDTVDKDGNKVTKKRTVPWRREESDFELLTGTSKDITGYSFAELRSIENRALAGDKDAIAEYESWSAGVLKDLYNKLWKNEGVYQNARLDKQQAEKIMPHEFWDTTTTRENAYVNGFIFRSYCYSMGLNPRFTGKNSRGKSVSHGDFSDSTGYWKLLIDRPMYANDGTYRDQKTVNVSKLTANENSLKPSGISNDLLTLHNFLRSLNAYYDRDPNLVQTPEEYEQAKENIDDYRYEVEELGNTELEEQLIGVAESVLGKYGVAEVVQRKMPVDAWLDSDGTLELTDGTRLDIMDAVNMVEDVRDVNIALYDDVANRWTESAVYRYDGWRHQVKRDSEDLFNLTPAEVDAIVAEIRDEIAAGNFNWETAKGQDSASTRFMKKLGYEGIDVRHLSQLDNTTYGSVIYDLKGKDLARKQEIGTAHYSLDDEEIVDAVSEKATKAFDVAVAEADANPVSAEDIGSVAQEDAPIGIAIYHQYLSQDTLDMISSNEVYQILLEQYGIIERRVPDYREANVPRKSKPNNKVSKTVPTVMGAKATPESRLPDIKSAVAHHRVSYLPTTNKKDIQYARNIIYRDGFDVAKADWTAKVRAGQTSPKLVALGATILNNMGNTSEVTGVEYVNMLVDYAELVRRAASSLQAAKILKNLTPEGKLYGIQREINKMNEDLKGQEEKDGKKKKRRPSGPPVEWWATKTGEMLASQLMRSLPSSTDSARVKTVCQQIANDIATVARESLPKDTNKKAVSQAERDQKVLDRIQNIFNNQAEYQKIWGRAKNKLVDKLGALPDSLLAFDAWMEDLPGYTAKLLSDAMFDGIALNPTLAEAFLTAETDADRDVVLEMIYADVASQVKATGMEKFNAVRYLFMLGNFRTQIRNVAGNLLFQVPRLASIAVQGSVEAMVGKVAKWGGKSVERTTSVLTDKATYKFALKDFENVRDAIMGGGKYEDAKGDSSFRDKIDKYRQILGFKAFSDESVAKSTGAGKVAKKVVNAVTMSPEYYRKATNWAMDKGDEFFCSFTYADSLARFMKANGTTWEKASEELREKARMKAIRDAAEATYRDNNQFAEMVAKIGKPRNPDNKAEKAVSIAAQGVLSFRKTPANILVRAYEYSPVGAGVTALGLLRDTVKIIAKQDVEIDGTTVIKKMSQGLTGTGLVILGSWLSSMGYLVGKAPEDEKEKQLWEMQGHQQYALEFDGHSYTLDWLAPECIPLFLGANLQQAALSSGISLGEFLKALGTLTDPILSMSMLQGVNDALENASSYGDDSALVRFAGNALWSYLTQAIAPTILGQIERGFEGQRMATYIGADQELKGVQKMVAKLSAKIPGWDYAQIVYTDAWGRTQDNPDSVTLNLLYQMFSPGYTSTIETSSMEEELLRLYRATGESKVLISTAGKTITVEGEDVALSGDEYYSYNVMRGQTAYDIMTALTSSPGYANMDDKGRAGAVTRVYDYATQMAKYDITGGAYVPDKWVLNAFAASQETGLPISTIVTYRCLMSAEDEANTTSVANANVRAAIWADTSMTDAQKTVLDDILINDNTVIPQDKKVDYSNYETFVITQMSDGAQKRWTNIKKQFQISADTYKEAWSIYHNDNLKADEKKVELGRLIGSSQKGILLYRVIGERLDK